MDWIVPACSHAEALNPKVIVFGDRAFKERITFKWGQKGGAVIRKNWHPYKKRRRHQERARTEKEPCEDIRRGQSSAGQEERPYQKPTLPGPRSWTSCLQDCEGIESAVDATQSVVFYYGSLSRLERAVSYMHGTGQVLVGKGHAYK